MQACPLLSPKSTPFRGRYTMSCHCIVLRCALHHFSADLHLINIPSLIACLSVCPSVRLPAHPLTFLCFPLLVCRPAQACGFLSLCLSVCLSVCLAVCLSVPVRVPAACLFPCAVTTWLSVWVALPLLSDGLAWRVGGCLAGQPPLGFAVTGVQVLNPFATTTHSYDRRSTLM